MSTQRAVRTVLLGAFFLTALLMLGCKFFGGGTDDPYPASQPSGTPTRGR